MWAAALREATGEMRNHGVPRPDAKPQELADGLLATLLGGMLITRAVRSAEPPERALNVLLRRRAAEASPPAVPGPHTEPESERVELAALRDADATRDPEQPRARS
jgi:hypothetical protein